MTAIPISAFAGRQHHYPRCPHALVQRPHALGISGNGTHPFSNRPAIGVPVQYINRPQADFRGLGGTVARGRIAVGNTVRVTASGQTAKIKRIIAPDGDAPEALAGSAITVVLDKELDASRGDILARADTPLEMTDQFAATVIWMHEDQGMVGRSYELKLAAMGGRIAHQYQASHRRQHWRARSVQRTRPERHCLMQSGSQCGRWCLMPMPNLTRLAASSW